jgi:hypothetical protein
LPKRKRSSDGDLFGLGSFNLDFGLGGYSGSSHSNNEGLLGLGNFNAFGQPRSEKQRKKDQIAENRETGLRKQRMDELSYGIQGYEVKRRKTGCDFEATRYNPMTGRTEHIYVESKSSSTAPMRPLQKKMQKKKRGHYRVERGGSFW